MSRLFTGCPVLNDLVVLRDGIDGMTNFNISIPKLKRLSIHFNSYKYPNHQPDYKLEIYTTALEYFEFCGDLHNVVFLEKLANLVEAHADIRAVEGPHMRWVRDNEIYCGDRIFKLLRALNNTKLFSLYPGDKECIGFGSIYPSRFQNLVRLDFQVNKCNWHVLQALLLVAPHLEVLVLHKHYHNSEEKLCWTEPPHDPGYLSSHLTTFYFEGLEHELEFVKYILKEARVLKKIKINVTDRQSKESVLEKLTGFPRHSTN
nr:putative fbd-associated f-box protein [Quercus suber]